MAGAEHPLIRTPDQRIRVFVSSTLRELADERRVVRAAIERMRLAPVMFELGARPHPPRELYRSYLAQSDVFVGIYADSYGWVAPDEEVSGLEDEYNLAPTGMPKLIYIKASDQRDPRLSELIARIQADDTAAYLPFETAEQLEEQVAGDLATLLAERFDASRRAGAHDDVGESEQAPETSDRPAPVAYSRLIGREREVDEVLSLVTSGEHRLVTLLGPGGIGKSRLAIEVCARADARFAGGAVFVELENVFEPQLILPTIAYALGIRDGGDASIEERLQRTLEGRRVLLVLDNFEQLVDDAAELVRLYTIAPDAVFLVTSRVVLRVRGERVYEVPPLASGGTPDHRGLRDAADAASAPAVELFVERARAVKPDFALTTANTPDVVALCRALDGLPLAIELAAARMRLLTPATVLSRLHGPGSVLTAAARDLPARQRTLRATIDWSVDLLEDEQRALLFDLGVFSADFTLEALEAVAPGRPWEDQAFEALEALVDGSLVSQAEVGGRAVFSMLVTLREYAVERLAEAGDERRMRDAHARYFLDLTERIAAQLGGPQQLEATLRLDVERGNLRTAVRHLTSVDDAEAATALAQRLFLYWWLRGYFSEVRLWMDELLATADDIPLHARAVAQFYHLWSEMWQTGVAKGDLVRDLDETAEVFRRSGDDFGATLTQTTACLARATMTDPALAETAAVLERCVAYFRDTNVTWAQTLALIALGRLVLALDDYDRARECFEAASEVASNRGEIFGLSIARHHLARMQLLAGETDAATAGFVEAMLLSMDLDHEGGIAYAIEGLCATAAVHGDAETAAALAGAAETLRRRADVLDPPELVYHLRYVDAASKNADAAAIAAAWDRGRSWSASEAAAFALEHVAASD